MLDRGAPYDRLPYFFSDQYDTGMEYTGLHRPADRLVLRGSLDEGRFQALWLGADGHATAGMHVNDWGALEPIQRLIESGRVVDPAILADPGSPIEESAARV
jgi:3-phenylpropionate/trans-cinnamate dioxygenase ferredoxin reductase subunit